MQAPSYKDWQDVKRIFRYLKGNPNLAITYRAAGSDTADLRAFTDADWAGDVEHRTSTSGLLVTFRGNPIHWKSSKQQLVAQSSTEAEYVAAASAYNTVMYLRQMLQEVIGSMADFTPLPTPIHIDNRGALMLAQSYKVNERTKHIDIRYHVLRRGVADKTIELIDTSTQDQRADFFTKPLPKEAHQEFIRLMDTGIVPPISRAIPLSDA
jgi:hypothetical protein